MLYAHFFNRIQLKGISQITIDTNIIELRNGWFLNIEEKTFVRDVYTQDQLGTITPQKYFAEKI